MEIEKFEVSLDDRDQKKYLITFINRIDDEVTVLFGDYVYVIHNNERINFRVIKTIAVDNIGTKIKAILQHEMKGYNEFKNKSIDPKEWVFDKIYKHE